MRAIIISTLVTIGLCGVLFFALPEPGREGVFGAAFFIWLLIWSGMLMVKTTPRDSRWRPGDRIDCDELSYVRTRNFMNLEQMRHDLDSIRDQTILNQYNNIK
jgi:hypothetical protein